MIEMMMNLTLNDIRVLYECHDWDVLVKPIKDDSFCTILVTPFGIETGFRYNLSEFKNKEEFEATHEWFLEKYVYKKGL